MVGRTRYVARRPPNRPTLGSLGPMGRLSVNAWLTLDAAEAGQEELEAVLHLA